MNLFPIKGAFYEISKIYLIELIIMEMQIPKPTLKRRIPYRRKCERIVLEIQIVRMNLKRLKINFYRI